jgi:hypothetical protein
MDRGGVLDWFAAVDVAGGLDPSEVAAALRAAASGTLVVLAPPALLVDRVSLRRACEAGRTELVMLDA